MRLTLLYYPWIIVTVFFVWFTREKLGRSWWRVGAMALLWPIASLPVVLDVVAQSVHRRLKGLTLLCLIALVACASPTESAAQTDTLTAKALTADGDSATIQVAIPRSVPKVLPGVTVFWKKPPPPPPVDTTPKPPPPPPPPPPTACTRTVPVSNSQALIAAASYANAGDCITLAAGTYSMPTQHWTRPGTAGKPITLEGQGSATILTTGSGGGLYLQASYWTIRKLRTTNGFFGWQTEGCNGCVFDSVEVDHMQQAGINLRYGTNHSTVKNSKIHDTGTSTPKWGEGIYVGGYATSANTGPDNLADDNFILNNTFWNIGAESIDLSDGADRLTATGNTIDGTGTASIYGQTNSLIGVRGTGHVITDNVLAHGKPYGIDQYNGNATYCRNQITDVTIAINIAGGTAKMTCP